MVPELGTYFGWAGPRLGGAGAGLEVGLAGLRPGGVETNPGNTCDTPIVGVDKLIVWP